MLLLSLFNDFENMIPNIIIFNDRNIAKINFTIDEIHFYSNILVKLSILITICNKIIFEHVLELHFIYYQIYLSQIIPNMKFVIQRQYSFKAYSCFLSQ